MAIQFARMRIITRSDGGNVVRSAAYNARSHGQSDLTGEKFYFADRDGSVHHEVMLPDGAPEQFSDFRTLWNEAQTAEKRINSQEAKELLLALPSNPEITDKQRLEMAQDFVQKHFVDQGLAAQLDIHEPHTGEENFHAHILLTTRRVGPDGMGAKARDLNGDFAKGFMMDGERWGEVWRDHQNEYFLKNNIDVRVDETSLVPGEHIGPERMRTDADVLAIKRNQERAILARDFMADPDRILDHLTRQKSSFSASDLNRYIDQYGFDEKTATDIFGRVIRSENILYTMDKNGEIDDQFTTKNVRRDEVEALQLSQGLLAEKDRMIDVGQGAKIAAKFGLSVEQEGAMEAGLSGHRLVVIRGRAGTGKSFMLSALREGLDQSGHDVIGLAPTNIVASSLKRDGFKQSSTVHSFLFREKLGKVSLKEGTRLIVDEGPMMDSGTMKELLEVAYRHRAAVVLVGDDGQLSAIERGGLFTNIAKIANAVEIKDVRRQHQKWSKEATEALARGDMKSAIQAYDDRGFIIRSDDQEGAKAALIEKWKTDFDLNTDAERFVFAYRNKDVDDFNLAMRDHLQKRGEVSMDNHVFYTKHGRFDFAKGDKIVMTGTDKKAGLINGQTGKIIAIKGQNITLKTDDKELVINAAEFNDFRHGYAGTIYKGQGKTVDYSYIYHTGHWGQSNAYVALSRHREDAHMFVAGEYQESNKLVKSLKRDDRKVTSLGLELADKSDTEFDFDMNMEFEVREDFKLHEQGVNDAFDDNKASLIHYRRIDPREAKLAELRADVAAAEIMQNEEAQRISQQRGTVREVKKHLSIARRSMARDFSQSGRYLSRAAKMITGYGRGL